MNISKENVDALNAVIKLTIEKADYEHRVEEVLKTYRKKVNMPGFRPGHVPAGLIKKMYGNAALVDEVNKLVGEHLFGFIRENEMDLLGEPLPSNDQQPIDFDTQSDFEFRFDVAIAPQIELSVSKIDVVEYCHIAITDDMVEGQVKNITSRFGENVTLDQVSEKAMVKGRFVQVDENNQPVEAGIVADQAVMSLAIVKDEAEKAKLLGAKLGDTVVFDPKLAFPNDTELSYLLKISKEEAAALSGQFCFTISEITEFKDAEFTQEVFDKVMGAGKVEGTEGFYAKVKEDLAATLAIESDYKFSNDARKYLMNQISVELPVEFLKRWIAATQDKDQKFTPEQIDAEMPKFIEDLKWQMVKNNLMKANNLKVTQADILAFAKKNARMQFLQYGLTNIPEEHIEHYAVDLLKNEEQRRHFAEGAANDVAISFIKSAVQLNEKTVSRADFNQLFEAQ